MVTENYYTPDRGLPAGVSHSYGSNEFLSFEYPERDGSDRITRIVETKDSVTQETSYTYDPFGRLHQVFDGEGELQATYSYDENGNRTAYCKPGSPCIEGEYNAQDQLVQYGANTYTYTLKGELETRGGIDGITHYSYDPMGNLSQAVLPNNTVIGYTYNANNRRIAKKVNGVITERFIYFNQLRPAARVNADSSIAEFYVYGTKENIPEYAVRDGNTYRIITDHLGSLRLVVDASDGTIKQKMAYDEFGIVTEDFIESGFEPLPFGYAGGLYDRDTQLVKFGARDYDPETGRWISKEPLGFAGSNNFYAYVDGDPVNKVDPSGLELVYYDEKSEKILKQFVANLFKKSNIAKNIMLALDDRPEKYVFRYEKGTDSMAKIKTDNMLGREFRINYIYIDPDFPEKIVASSVKNVSISNIKASPERKIAHELGHYYSGMGDNSIFCDNSMSFCSPGDLLERMSNVVKYENPIMLEFGESYERVQYEY